MAFEFEVHSTPQEIHATKTRAARPGTRKMRYVMVWTTHAGELTRSTDGVVS